LLRAGHDLHDLSRILLRDTQASRWLLFENPEEVLIARTTAEVGPVVSELERRVSDDGVHAAGYLSYEAAPAFDAALTTHEPGTLPLACFGLFAEPQVLDRLPGKSFEATAAPEWQLSTSKRTYLDNIRAIRRQIELGNTYQVNYTIRQQARADIDAWDLFTNVAADAPYAAFLDFGAFTIVSASPELFFALEGTRLNCRPMKGTAPRGMTTSTDNAAALALRQSAKDRAENVMITDMLRNDMGRVAEAGSVRVDSLYDVEKYPTVWQMTSSISATTDAGIHDILAALFPCASVTGAPKAASMGIIAELEDTPREIYTGAIGYLGPGRRAQFNVAIRTAWLDKATNVATYGIGGGIVWDSEPEAEFRECMSKARVLETEAEDRSFSLIETMLWTSDEGYSLIDEHLDRLRDSAEYFEFEFDRARILSDLAGLADRMHRRQHRVRLLLRRNGITHLEQTPLPDIPGKAAARITLAAEPVDIASPLLYHKTTRRDVYDRAIAGADGFDDVLLWNPDGFITETTIANVVVRIGRELYTPPVDCGLLAGTYRDWLLRSGQVRERAIHVSELDSVDELQLINSVRGFYPAELVKDFSNRSKVRDTTAPTQRS
jgi:para-aminobenzoate synthetase/4-amino-4-deoxychorismate lyase